MWVVDTNVVGGLLRGDEGLITHLARMDRRSVRVPEPVWAEIVYGLEKLPPSRKRETLRGRYRDAREELTTTPWTAEVSEAFGQLKATLEKRGARLDDFDLAIAAHAVALDATLVTANLRHLARIDGLEIEDWSR
jgi:tRNA(fMet)-specific endonuclease VapC